ncbi:hypothetical protein FRC12_011769 [Ceratobasidium sp. 428]|nr:hypothetical protein FRC12_011769 [Ceratobasidium sp. 428]
MKLLTLAVAVALTSLAGSANALWCTCKSGPATRSCCQTVMGADTFWGPLFAGNVCDVGPKYANAKKWQDCCKQWDGPTNSGYCK